ncbi:EAL domain-containing protein [Aliivibrio kagoshimensis]|uniref:EAL domain-containing protein n=1 Tax=Aliivibrio kagoshimensis TaxID=2910230 RepID=UPI003D0BD7F2
MYNSELSQSLFPQLIIKDQHIFYCNPAFLEMTGYNKDELIGCAAENLFSELENVEEFLLQLHITNNTASTKIFDYNHFSLPVKIQVKSAENPHDLLVGFHLINNKSHDVIANMPNGWALRSRVDYLLADAPIKKKMNNIALLVIDIDNFSSLNYRYSFKAGDHYLERVGAVLQQSISYHGFAVRFSNAKYGVLIEADNEITEEIFYQRIKYVSDLIIKASKRAIDVGDGVTVQKHFSIGVSQPLSRYGSYHEMELAAETAMLEAKKVCNTSIVYSKSEASVQMVNEKLIIEELPKAIETNSIQIFYQPQYDIESGELTAFEALSRWALPELGPIAPDLFVGIAEKIGLHYDFDFWVFSQVCTQISSWLSHAIIPVKIAVNVSLKSLEMDSFIPRLQSLLSEFDFPLHLIEIEMTETGSISNISQFRTNICNLSDLGISIAVDDFGTGYSSLNLIREFHPSFSKLKIDRALIMNIETNETELEFIKHIVKLGELFGLQVLAEGIEKVEQLTLLRSTGCHFAQGYYFNKPVPYAVAEQLLIARSIKIDN